jgi:CPA2 family monovalent cation:H+ antiporter-2
VGVGLGQIGEFSFILAGLGVGMGLFPHDGRDLILAGAILSILLNPFLFGAVQRGQVRVLPSPRRGGPPVPEHSQPPEAAASHEAEIREPLAVTTLLGHDVVVGYGRVGSMLGRVLAAEGRSVLVFEEREPAIKAALDDGAQVVTGNAADPEVLAAANLGAARRLFVTIGQAFEAGQVVQQARAVNSGLEIVARAHSDAEVNHLDSLGADLTVMGEREIALRMIERAREHGHSTREEPVDEPAAVMEPDKGVGPM